MPFKIVQTTEEDKTELSIVPLDWEARGKLFWPQKNVKNRSRLIKDDRSKPSPEWDIINCTVKRSNILTYREAVAEIKIMEGQTDTDNDINENHTKESAQTIGHGQTCEETNFEAMADMLQSKQNLPTVNKAPSTSQPSFQLQSEQNLPTVNKAPSTSQPSFQLQSEQNLPIVNEAPSTSQTNNNVILIDQPTESTEIYQLCTSDYSTQIVANQALMLEKINNLCENLNTVIENQKTIGYKLACLSVKMDEGNYILQKMEPPVTLLKDANAAENESYQLRDIDNLKQLEDFELLLLDHFQRKKMKKILSILCSASEGNGITCAYKLLDTLLSRDFLCKCSWSGGSRGKSSSKIALKDHQLFIKFFFEMILSWDSSFTIEKMDFFFKIVLKNAAKRKTMKNVRASSKRTRKVTPKTATNTVTQPPQDNQSNEPINENHDHPMNETDNAEHADNVENMETNNETAEEELDLC